LELIPAIDMIGGKCVRLTQGVFDDKTVYANDPVEVALRWESLGAQRLHIVDLEGSRAGHPLELETVKRIVAAVKIPVQMGGGIRTSDICKQVLDVGVSRVIIGTSAATDEDFAKSVFAWLGEQAVLGVDAKGGFVAVKGWEETTSEEAISFAQRMQSYGAKRVIYTDISRDGMLKGANIEAMKQMAEALAVPVIASGGVTSLDDVKALADIESIGIEAAILGKALYTGHIDFSQALKITQG